LGSAALKLTGHPFAGVRFPQCISSTCCLLTQIIKMTPGERRSGAAFQQLTDEEFCSEASETAATKPERSSCRETVLDREHEARNQTDQQDQNVFSSRHSSKHERHRIFWQLPLRFSAIAGKDAEACARAGY